MTSPAPKLHLDRMVTFHGRPGPVLLVVLDGVGLAPATPANAVAQANTPVLDELLASRHATQLHAHGLHVGLPADTDMGNSEVGHNTLGGGRIFVQGAKLVRDAFADESIFASECWREVEARGQRGHTVHFLGLLSDGNVHANIEHLLLLLARCEAAAIRSVCVHILLDGRDVEPRSSPRFIAQLQAILDRINRTATMHYRIASGGGRMCITMDRYQADWAMVERGVAVHVFGEVGTAGQRVLDAAVEVQRQLAADPNLTDQYLAPFVVVDDDGPVGLMQDGDAVVLFNFRGDRAIEICQALTAEAADFTGFARPPMPAIYFCGMLEYDGDLHIPANYLVSPSCIDRTMVEFLCAEKLPTFAVSETQKFGHVTYFWNGNKSGYIDEQLETYIEIPSDLGAFDQNPQMKAVEITDATIELLVRGDCRFGRINFANGDMVGHTGNIAATIAALECVDQCLGRLLECVRAQAGIFVLTADHGNADEMFVMRDGEKIMRTSHTLNPVPFVIVDSQPSDAFEIDRSLDGGLANVAATIFNLLGFRPPPDYEPSLLQFCAEPTRQTLYRGKVIDFGLECVTLPNHEQIALEIVRHPGGAIMVAIAADKKFCVLRQYRHAAGGYLWEFPAGTLEAGETPQQVAVRELQEETGLTAACWRALGEIILAPGFCDERLHIFVAEELTHGQPTPEAHEQIEIHWLSLPELTEMIANGTLYDAKTIAALYKLQQLSAS